MKKRELLYKTLCRAGECLCKQDIPEVERVIAFMVPLLERAWNQAMEAATRDALRFLISLDDLTDGRDVDFLETLNQPESAAFISRIENRVFEIFLGASRQFPERVEEIAEDASRDLILLGALLAGVGTGIGPGTVDSVLRTAAVEDIRTMLSGRIQLREHKIKGLARQWLRDSNVRSPVTATLAAPGATSGSVVPSTRAQWDIHLRGSVGLQSFGWIGAVTDVWAYRWFSIGAYRSLRRAGVTIIVAQATRDNRTTAFCRWADGRRLNTGHIDKQIERHAAAVLAGDPLLVQENWPLITDQSLLTGTLDTKAASRAFNNLGLPPWHFRCRTVPRAVRTA